jgi:hypothetical protein
LKNKKSKQKIADKKIQENDIIGMDFEEKKAENVFHKYENQRAPSLVESIHCINLRFIPRNHFHPVFEDRS